MKKNLARNFFITILSFISTFTFAQQNLTPELLWKLGRVNAAGITKDKQAVIYSVSTPNVAENKSNKKIFSVSINDGKVTEINNADNLLADDKISPDGKYKIFDKEVQMIKTKSTDIYPDLPKSEAYVFTSLNFRHWDIWEDGKYDHVFVASLKDGKQVDEKDIMPRDTNDCPQKPFGDDGDYIWNPDSKHIVYVTKKKFGTAYAISTNTDLFEYNIETGTTKNLTFENKGYDVAPAYNAKGELAWLQMKRDGYEADKQDIIVFNGKTKLNLTRQNDLINVESFKWSEDGKSIFFIAPINGTLQLFNVTYPGLTKMMPSITQITKGDFDVTSIIGQVDDKLIVTRTDFNHATELYTVNLSSQSLTRLTHVNDEMYAGIGMCKSERKFVTTTDGKQMLVWVVYPPNFDATKKYPTLLYCQGGPQSALTQFYSFRWNFQLIASQGYIVVAPCRRGMPGFGTKWNEDVSKDWGGLVIKDYLSAIDAISKESYVDKNRRGCVGASFGGFSVFALEGQHNGRFKTFIAHDGVFDFRSMYGTTDEMWFENWEKGGAYWEKNNAAAQRSFNQSPSNFVSNWNTPIMIVQGGIDYRVPVEQGLGAFKAAQIKGIKSKLLYLPNENHWVLSMQNALVWQREFFNWLDETLR